VIIGHGVCTAIAVMGGRLLAAKISVRTGTQKYENIYLHPWLTFIFHFLFISSAFVVLFFSFFSVQHMVIMLSMGLLKDSRDRVKNFGRSK
jgi:putative Ca2+/H+ antiporter (TMEM165/GDT1 family)